MGPFGSTQSYQSADSGGCRFRRAANPLRLALQDSSKVPIQAGADSGGQEGFRVALSKVPIQAGCRFRRGEGLYRLYKAL